MKLLINIIAIIVVAVVIGFQFNRTKNLYNKKYDENKDEFKKDQEFDGVGRPVLAVWLVELVLLVLVVFSELVEAD